jgi:ABC-2 type transport system permease protein
MTPAVSSPLGRLWRQTKAFLSIYIQDGLAYRASGMIWILNDVVIAFTLPLVWLAAAGSGTIGGKTGSDFVAYYVVMLLFSNFITCHFMWEINQEIKDGALTSQLLRPASYLHFMFMRNLAWRLVRSLLFLPWFLLFLFVYQGNLSQTDLNFGLSTLAAVFLGHCVSFFFVMALSMLALFVEEASSIFELYYFPMLFLGGSMFPVSVLPGWVQNLAVVFPFYYAVGAPADIATGRIPESQVPAILGVQLLWIGLSIVLHVVLFRVGMKRYQGVGL